MCFILPKGSEVKIAEQDIPCLKVALNADDCGCESEYLRFMYKYGNEYRVNPFYIVEVGGRWLGLDGGFHSYRSDTAQGRRDAYHDSQWGLGELLTVVSCIIPAGSKYYQNESQYFSEKIIITGKYEGSLNGRN